MLWSLSGGLKLIFCSSGAYVDACFLRFIRNVDIIMDNVEGKAEKQ